MIETAIGAAYGKRVVASQVVTGGYTQARRLRVTFSDGTRAFVKAAVDPMTAGWLRDEERIYSALPDESFLPRRLAFVDAETTLLILEDLTDAFWPRVVQGASPWTADRIASVLATLERVHQMPSAWLPTGLPRLEDDAGELRCWERVAAAPEEFLSLGLCSQGWLEVALPHLVTAERRASLVGESLCHVDVRSDNLCFRPDGSAVLVDWNWARIGNPEVDIAGWLSSLRAEGGPLPETILPDAGAWAALFAGFWAWRAGMPPPPTSPQVREIQRRQLAIALPWAVRTLALAPPG